MVSNGPMLALDAVDVCITQPHERTERAACVQLLVNEAMALVQLSDPALFNTFSNELGEDMRRAVQHVSTRPDFLAVVLEGAGPHFSVGGNPYSMSDNVAVQLAGFAIRIRELYDGFVRLRSLCIPIVGGVHGTLVGGGIAACLHADCLMADRASTFEHGNLVRGVCVLGMLSQTFAIALGPHAQHVYLLNVRLDATAAHAAGLVHQLCEGASATQMQARKVAGTAADGLSLVKAMCAPINQSILAREAFGHTECQVVNGGFAKSRVHSRTSVLEKRLDLRAVVVSRSVQHTETTTHMVVCGFGSDAGLRTEELCRWRRCFSKRVASIGEARWERAHVRRPVALVFDRAMRLAVVKLKLRVSGSMPTLKAALCLLTSLGPAVRALTLHVHVGCAGQLTGSTRSLECLGRALDALHGLGVPITYLAGQAASHAVPSAAWHAAHPKIGVMQMLSLTRSRTQKSVALRSHGEASAAVTAQFDDAGSRSETNMRLARQAAQVAALIVPTARSMTPAINGRRSLLSTPARLISGAPCQLAACSEGGVDVRALEVYTPHQCVKSSSLAARHGFLGLCTRRLFMERHSCGEDEDAVSMALTVVHRLLRRCSVHTTAVGMLHVGATLLDRSKSMKTELTTLIEAGEVAHTEGVDGFTSRGGLSVLLSCVSWARSASWDGRWAVAVCSVDCLVPPSGHLLSSAEASALLVGAQQVDGNHSDGLACPRLIKRQWMAPLVTGELGKARAVGEFDIEGRLLARMEARRLLDAAAMAAACAQRTTTVGRFGRVARPADPKIGSAYYLLETASPTPDGAAGRRYRVKELTPVAIATSQVVASAPSLLRPPSPLQQVEGGVNHLLAPLLTEPAAAPGSIGVASSLPVHAKAMLREVATELLPRTSADAPLLEAGLDSLGAVEFRNRLTARLGDAIELPETLVFDFPTLRQLDAHLNAVVRLQVVACEPTVDPVAMIDAALLLSRAPNALKTPSAPAKIADTPKGIYIVGVSCKLPSVNSLSGYSFYVDTGHNALVQVPPSRWAFETTAAGLDASVASRCRFAGFMAALELFDSLAFLLSPAETTAMDPQQRLLLERGYELELPVVCARTRVCDCVGVCVGV